jgi:hypothetical protein
MHVCQVEYFLISKNRSALSGFLFCGLRVFTDVILQARYKLKTKIRLQKIEVHVRIFLELYDQSIRQ